MPDTTWAPHRAIIWGQQCQNWFGPSGSHGRCQRPAMGLVEWFATCRECHDNETEALTRVGLHEYVGEYKVLGWRTDLSRKNTYAWIDKPLGADDP